MMALGALTVLGGLAEEGRPMPSTVAGRKLLALRAAGLFASALWALPTIAAVSSCDNYAMSLDGRDDFITVPDSDSLDLATGMTIEVWINSETNSGPRVFISKWSRAGDLSYIFKDHNFSDKLEVTLVLSNGDSVDLEGSTSIPPSRWVHVAATYDSAAREVRLYLNGQLDASIGTSGGGNTPFRNTIINRVGLQRDRMFRGPDG
jgi:hypothetical protein